MYLCVFECNRMQCSVVEWSVVECSEGVVVVVVYWSVVWCSGGCG